MSFLYFFFAEENQDSECLNSFEVTKLGFEPGASGPERKGTHMVGLTVDA